MTCEYCGKIERKVYEDDDLVAFLKPNPAVPGHIILTTKQHFTILEQVPDDLVGRLFDIANVLSSILFEAFGAEGTNMIVQNGTGAGQKIPHLALNILPRKQNDGLNFEWEPKQVDKEEFGVIELKLKKCCGSIILDKKEEKVEEVSEEPKKPEDPSWINKILHRIP